MTWRKKNLVTLPDGSDEYQCSECGFKKKYYSLFREGRCPKCVQNKDSDVFGAWTSLKHNPTCVYYKSISCVYCKSILVACPQDHPNSKYLYLKQDDGLDLYVCPNGCLEDGSGINTTAVIKKSGRTRWPSGRKG